jgi:ubiquinol oxidase
VTTLTANIPTQRTSTETITPPTGKIELWVGQQETLAAPRRPYSIPARILFAQMDLLYGRRNTIQKFRVLETVARLPYEAWATTSSKRLKRVKDNPSKVAQLIERIRGFRAQQENEQWHLMVMNDLVEESGVHGNRFMHRFLPRLISFGYWHFCWLLYVLKPRWSHRLNADFEDHAEHTYAEFLQDHPELDTRPWNPRTAAGYGDFETQGDLLRQICLDERHHKQESEKHL